MKSRTLRPNDEQLVARLTNGNFAMTDQVSVCAQLGFSTTAKDHGHVGGLLAGKIGSNKFVVRVSVVPNNYCDLCLQIPFLRCLVSSTPPRRTMLSTAEPNAVTPSVMPISCSLICALARFLLLSSATLLCYHIPSQTGGCPRRTGHSCRTHWYHLPCIFRSFRRACKGTKTITAVSDIANFDRLRPSDQQHIRICIQCAKKSRDRTVTAILPVYKSSDTVSDGSHSVRAGESGSESPPATTEIKPMKQKHDPPKVSRKRKSSAVKPPPPKKSRMNDMNVSEHEVAGILGLTMLSQPNEKGPLEDGAAKGSVNPGAECAVERPSPMPSAHSESDPFSKKDAASRTVAGAQFVKASLSSQPSVNPDHVLPVDREKIPPEWRLGPNFTSPTFTEEVSRRWRAPGTSCEFLYRDQWHLGVVESYTSQEAIVKFENREGLVPIDLVTEKHRVCWQLGTYTKQSKFA